MAHASAACGNQSFVQSAGALKSFSKKLQALGFRKKSECLVPILAGKDEVKPAQSKVSVKLTDFGIGQVVSAEAMAGVTNAGFTQTIVAESSSSQTGSQMYMAPELLAGKPASTRSDIYSLGVVLYQLLAGDLTHPLTTDWADHISDPLLRDDLKHCFAGNPQERFEGAGQLAKNLRSLAARRAELERQQAELAARERAAYRRGMIRAAAVAVIIVAAVTALAIFAFQQARRADRNAERAITTAGELRRNLYVADIKVAHLALEENNLGHAQTLLGKYLPPSNIAASGPSTLNPQLPPKTCAVSSGAIFGSGPRARKPFPFVPTAAIA